MARNGVLGIIPARGGSKGLPRKNILPLGGRPLITWTIDAAMRSGCIDRLVVSTDDLEIEEVASNSEAEVLQRPVELSSDNSLVMDAVRDVLSRIDFDPEIVVLLQPTSPLRRPRDIRECVERLQREAGLDSIATYVEATLNPWRAWRIVNGVPSLFIPDADPWLPRQELPEAFQLNGAVYAFRVSSLPINGTSFVFGKSGAVVMSPERSLDIDSEIDLVLAETVVSKEEQ